MCFLWADQLGYSSSRIRCICAKKKMIGLNKAYYPGIQFRLPCTPPENFFMCTKMFIGTPWMGNEGVLKKILVWTMWNCMVSMPTHSEFEIGGLPIEFLSFFLLILARSNFDHYARECNFGILKKKQKQKQKNKNKTKKIFRLCF